MSLNEKGQEYITRFKYADGHKKNARIELGLAAGFGFCALKGVGFMPSDLDAVIGFYMGARSVRSYDYSRQEQVAGEIAREEALGQKTLQYSQLSEPDDAPEQKAA